MRAEKKPFIGIDDRTILADAIPLESPFTLNIFPSNICNFKCKYCEHSLGGGIYTQEKHIIPEFMTWEQFIKVADQLKKFPQTIKEIFFASLADCAQIAKNSAIIMEFLAAMGWNQDYAV